MAPQSRVYIPARLRGPRPKGTRGQFIKVASAKRQIRRLKQQDREKPKRHREFLVVKSYAGKPKNTKTLDGLYVTADSPEQIDELLRDWADPDSEEADDEETEKARDLYQRIPWTETTIIEMPEGSNRNVGHVETR